MTKLMMIAALAATTAFATPAFASSTNTTVWANIAPVCTIVGPADNGSINLHGDTPLGNVVLTCNDPQGFTASVQSANHGNLADSSGGNSPTTYGYKLNVGPVANISLAGTTTVNSATYGTAAAAAAIGGITLPVSMTVNGPNNGAAEFAGTYSDVITWTVDANG